MSGEVVDYIQRKIATASAVPADALGSNLSATWNDPIAEAFADLRPLDDEIDGAKLRHLLALDENQRRESNKHGRMLSRAVYTPAQHAAVSAFHSAQLRARIAAGPSADAEAWRAERAKERRDPERSRVVVDLSW